MIDYDRTDPDPVVAEVRRAREEILAQFGFDLHELFAEKQRLQTATGRKYATSCPLAPSSPDLTKKAG